MKKTYLITIYFLLTLSSWAQSIHWYTDKPNTKTDSLNIIKYKVKTIHERLDPDTIPTYRTVTFIISNNLMDSVLHNDLLFHDRNVVKISADKIVELITLRSSSTDSSKNICRMTHYLNKDGQIIETKNEILSGTRFEGQSFTKIKYIYKDGLLTESNVFDYEMSKTDPYMTFKYSYDFY